MRIHRAAVFCVMTAVAAAALDDLAAGASIVPLQQQRRILGDSNAFGPPAPIQDFQEFVAPGFGPLNETVKTNAVVQGAATVVQSAQQSTISDCMLAGAVDVLITAQGDTPESIAYGVGMSDFRVTFAVNEPALCRVVGVLDADQSSQCQAFLQQGNTVLFNTSVIDQIATVAHQRLLPAGQYTVTYNATGTASVSGRGVDTSACGFDLRLSVCFAPADLDINGVVNIDDLLGLINSWGACSSPETCLADIDLDGAVDMDDLLALINAWG